MASEHPAKLKKQGSLGRMMLSSKSLFSGKSFKYSASSFRKAASSKSFKQAATSLWSSGKEPGRSAGSASFSAADLVTEAAKQEAKQEKWAGTLSVTDEGFEQRYFVRQQLGAGSFGTVHRVIRVTDGAELAAKTISHRGHDGEWAEALEEARIWAQVSSPLHPAILPLLETLMVEGRTLHLVTELMPHDVLGDAIFNVIMSEQAARLIMVQLVSAVAHLHLVHSMAHRDVKPDNVLCAMPDPTMLGCLKLADFGLCKPFLPSAEEGSFDDACGTIDYAAPELAAGFVPPTEPGGPLPSVAYGPRVDVFALGCVCYELLHGQPPFYASKAEGGEAETIRRILAARDASHEAGIDGGEPVGGTLSFPDASFGHISDPGLAFLRGMLAPSQWSRFSIHEALSHAWLQPVSDESLRVAMCSSPTQANVAQRRAQRTNTVLRGAGQKVLAANRMSKAGAAKRANGSDAANSSEPPRIVAKPDGSFRARSANKKPVSSTAPKPPARLLSAPSTVALRSPPHPVPSSSSVLAAVASSDVASNIRTEEDGSAAAVEQVDPMAHYVTVYKGLFEQHELFASPERRQIADSAKRQGLSLAEMAVQAERAAKEKKARASDALQPLEA